MSSITVNELLQKINNNDDIQLIDVRESWEHEEFNIGGQLIPLGDIVDNIDKIEKSKPVVLYCRKGIRSLIAIQKLQQKYPFSNLINLSGGMDAWRREIASSKGM